MRAPATCGILAIATTGLLATGCAETSLRSVRIWEGAADCEACEATAIDLRAYTGIDMPLHRDSTYTVEVLLDLGDHEDRCIYKITSQTWIRIDFPREFNCLLPEERMTSTFSTSRDPYAPPADTDRLWVDVREYDVTTRQRLQVLFRRTYTIEWR